MIQSLQDKRTKTISKNLFFNESICHEVSIARFRGIKNKVSQSEKPTSLPIKSIHSIRQTS